MIESYDIDLKDVCNQLVEYIYNAGGQAGPNSQELRFRIQREMVC
ncbi:hypothetical protein HAPAU_41200 [Halalkalicoccus paucihalophilus]|uniref:Uncharacterized protein n=1 Tax=Halalkalicoccus paucihalophilus TaxID=1008153 RepID=A0A151A8N8_9EURY|nr:hypothetical protein HAPAU_41200 [Halalkalicoccus paucihalophilus]